MRAIAQQQVHFPWQRKLPLNDLLFPSALLWSSMLFLDKILGFFAFMVLLLLRSWRCWCSTNVPLLTFSGASIFCFLFIFYIIVTNPEKAGKPGKTRFFFKNSFKTWKSQKFFWKICHFMEKSENFLLKFLLILFAF